MAGTIPFFLTGANARIMLNNKSVAFATDVTYKVTVRHASPRVLGRFEVEVNQPLSYEVSGSMTIIRYARGLKDFFGDAVPSKDVSESGNGMGSFGAQGIDYSTLGLPNSKGQIDGAADEALIPQKFFQSKMFNIEIRQKLPFAPGKGNVQVQDDLIRNTTNPRYDETSVVLLRDCRITDMTFELSKRGVAMQRLSFVARYADDDTFIARKSGVGQELS